MAAVATPAMPPPTHDPSDEAMCLRARERYAADRKRDGRVPRRRRRHAALPNLIIIGGLKCGTTSIHHYLGLHPEINMSKPKELNFFVTELNWDLGLDWYRGRFDDRFEVRGESSPHYTNLPYFTGVPERIHRAHPRREADLHGPRPDLPDPLALVPRGRCRLRDADDGGGARPRRPDLRDPARATGCSCSPTSSASTARRSRSSPRRSCSRDRQGTMRKAFAFAGVDHDFYSEQFDPRVGEVLGEGDRPLPVHGEADQAPRASAPSTGTSTGSPSACAGWSRRSSTTRRPRRRPSRRSPTRSSKTLRSQFTEDVAALQEFAGREFSGWKQY